MQDIDISNYHTHCNYCDGNATPEEFVGAAIKKKIKYLGFSCHSPVPFVSDWNMQPEKLTEYIRVIKTLNEKYKGKIELFVGLELDYLKDTIYNPFYFRHKGVEYFIGSVHYMGKLNDGTMWTIDSNLEEFNHGFFQTFNNNVKDLVFSYYVNLYHMFIEWKPEILGHFDLVKKNNINNSLFDENDFWYQSIVDSTLRKLSKTNIILEINTGGLLRNRAKDLYPSEWIIRKCLDMNIPVTINSDAHIPEHLDGLFYTTLEKLRNIGYRSIMQLTLKGWKKNTI